MNRNQRMVATAVLSFLLTIPASAWAEKMVLKLGNVQAPGMTVQTGLKKMADLVRERTNGEIDIQVFPASQLGSEQEILEGVALGSIHMFEGSAGSLGRFLPQIEAFACPFLWKSPQSLVKVARSPLADELSKELVTKRGMRILDQGWIFGIRQLTTTKTPVRVPADLNGLKIRVQPDAIYLATVKAMGGAPTPIAANEVYTALQTGVADGQENPMSNIRQRKLYEVQKQLMLTGHITQNQVLVINEAVFQKLTPAQRDIIAQAAHEAGDYQNEIVLKSDAADLDGAEGSRHERGGTRCRRVSQGDGGRLPRAGDREAPRQGLLRSARRDPAVTASNAQRVGFDPLRKPLDLALALTVLAPSIAVFVQVVYRYLLNDPTSWLDEFATLCFGWMTLLGAAVVQRSDAHMSIDIFVLRMPRPMQVGIYWLRFAICAGLLVLLFWLGLDLAMRMSFVDYPAMGISRSYLFAILPAGAPLILYYLVWCAIEGRRRIRAGGPVFMPPHEAAEE